MGIWKERPDDSFGCAAAYSRLSPSISALDRATALFAGQALPVRTYELALEPTKRRLVLAGSFSPISNISFDLAAV
jgi:porin